MSNIIDSELLSAYLDHELNSEEFNRVNAFLVRSAEWRCELEKLRKAKTFLSAAPRLSCPDDLLDALQARLPQPKQRSVGFFFSPSSRWVLASSLATVAVIAGAWI